MQSTFFQIRGSVTVKVPPDLEDSHDIPKELAEHYERGELGVKTKKGFYDYANGKDVEATKARDTKLQKLFDALYKE